MFPTNYKSKSSLRNSQIIRPDFSGFRQDTTSRKSPFNNYKPFSSQNKKGGDGFFNSLVKKVFGFFTTEPQQKPLVLSSNSSGKMQVNLSKDIDEIIFENEDYSYKFQINENQLKVQSQNKNPFTCSSQVRQMQNLDIKSFKKDYNIERETFSALAKKHDQLAMQSLKRKAKAEVEYKINKKVNLGGKRNQTEKFLEDNINFNTQQCKNPPINTDMFTTEDDEKPCKKNIDVSSLNFNYMLQETTDDNETKPIAFDI